MRILKNKGLRTGNSFSLSVGLRESLLKERATSTFAKTIESKNSLCIVAPLKEVNTNKYQQPYPPKELHRKVTLPQKKTMTLTKFQKPSLYIEKRSPLILQKTELVQNQENIMTIMQRIIKILENNYILTQKQSSLFIIKKQNFVKILINCLFFRTSINQQNFMQNHQEFDSSVQKIWKKIEQAQNHDKKRTLKISGKLSEKYIPKDYSFQVMIENSKLMDLKLQYRQKQQAITQLKNSMVELQSRQKLIFKTLGQKQRQLYNMEEKAKELKQAINNLEKNAFEKSAILETINVKYSQVFSFVETQNKSQIIKEVSEEYKRIQGDIYDYAAQLQSNQLASSLTYEHLPIICHTHLLEDEITEINTTLVQNEQLPIIQKGRRLRDFLMKVVQKYRKKDIQVQKLMEFKTKCIKNFIEKMSKWMNNWELKQQYLKNIRIGHIVNHQQILKKFIAFDQIPICSNCKVPVAEEKKKILQIYLKLNQNFNMGNSFY